MQKFFLKAIFNHKKRNKKSEAEVQLVASCWWDLSGIDTSIPGQYFSSFFINNLHGEQGNTQFADGTEMGVVADLLRGFTS